MSGLLFHGPNFPANQGDHAVAKANPILVVEDEYLLVLPIEDALIEAGYEAVSVGSAEEAAFLLGCAPGKYSALVTDIDLRSRSNGWELARKARQLDPECPVVYMTGASLEDWRLYGVSDSVFLQKPFQPKELVSALCGLLNKVSSQAGEEAVVQHVIAAAAQA
jgi:DNA-binding response OmpR family regulator